MTDPSPDGDFRCSLCSEVLGTADAECRPWIILNRYCFCSGRSRVCVEGKNEDGDYLWELDADPTGDDYVTGPLLCWPKCAMMWLEAKGVQADLEAFPKSEGR